MAGSEIPSAAPAGDRRANLYDAMLISNLSSIMVGARKHCGFVFFVPLEISWRTWPWSRERGVTTLARTRSLSRQIRQAREVKGFTVAELADKVGVSQVSIYYWESGRVRPRDTNLTLLCKALKMPLRETMALTGR